MSDTCFNCGDKAYRTGHTCLCFWCLRATVVTAIITVIASLAVEMIVVLIKR